MLSRNLQLSIKELFTAFLIFSAPAGFDIKITEVLFKGGADWVELYCVEDGGVGVDISELRISDLDGEDDEALASHQVTLKRGKYAVIHFSDGLDETDLVGDKNLNGYIDLYVSQPGLQATDDQVVLLLWDGTPIDAVCWANMDGVWKEKGDVDLLIEQGMWSGEGGEARQLDCVDSRRLRENQSIARAYKSEDTNSYRDWWVESNPTPGAPSLALDVTPPSPLQKVKAWDLKPDKGGCLVVSWTKSSDDDFSHYNVYISTKRIERVRGLNPSFSEKDISSTTTLLTNMNGMPLINGMSYWVAVTAVDGSGNEGEGVSFGPVTPEVDVEGEPKMIITEVAFNSGGGGFEEDWVEIICLDDGNDGEGINIFGYGVDDLDGEIDKVILNCIIKTSECLLLHYCEGGGNEETSGGDGVIHLYTKVQGITSTDEQIVLTNTKGEIIDAVCWVKGSDGFTKSEVRDVQFLIDRNQWEDCEPRGADISDCIDSTQVGRKYSIARIPSNYDTNKKDDWKVTALPTPGIPQPKPLPGDVILRINEVSFKDEVSDWIELYCVKDGGGGVDLSGCFLKAGTRLIKVIGDGTFLRSGEYLVVREGSWEEDERSAGADGVLYVFADELELTSTDSLIILYSASGGIEDAVLWANDDSTWAGGLSPEAMLELVNANEWEIEGDEPKQSDCVDSRLVGKGESIVRMNPYEDTNSRGDWSQTKTPTMGRSNTEPPPKLQLLDVQVVNSPFLIGKEETIIFFSTSIETHVKAKVYDVRGRLIKNLEEIYSLPNRRESIRWSGLDEEGEEVPIGVYLLFIEATTSNDEEEKVIPIVAAKELD